jgi:ATP adenylyltransferase
VSQRPLAANSNPFLPYDENLYVGELNAHYRCLLNKFNVIDEHILLVTSKFTEQLTPLTTIDFETAMLVLQAKEGLVFYNGGEKAGASVRHKHLQMIPAYNGNDNRFPMETLFETDLRSSTGSGRLLECTTLPFPHRVAPSHFSQLNTDLATIATENYNLYSEMLTALDLASGVGQPARPHNLLITRRYLWVIPRSKDNHAGIAVNALGFSGTLLLINDRQLEVLSRMGILATLREVVF